MKSKNIPADIRDKSIKEAESEIKEIIETLENIDVNLENSKEKYVRMMQLNLHIQETFRRKVQEINQRKLHKNKKRKN